MKSAIYCRVSTSKQELENQLIQLREYCQKSNWNVYKEYNDIISGGISSRPSFDELFVDAHKKLFDIVLFWDLSRFSRSGTLYTLQKLKELDNLGIKWHSYQEPYFSTMGDFKDVIISIMSTIAKIEREKISDRTKSGLQRTKKKLGRPRIPKDVVKQVVSILKNQNCPPYSEISKMVMYKTKYGRIHHISPAQITQIKKSYLEKGGEI
jgi:DNA invertase Pin-like site-specific DNA recombinase